MLYFIFMVIVMLAAWGAVSLMHRLALYIKARNNETYYVISKEEYEEYLNFKRSYYNF